MSINQLDILNNLFTTELKEYVDVKEDESDCCVNPSIVYNNIEGENVCNNCGLVINRELDSLFGDAIERRTLRSESDNYRTGIAWNGSNKHYNVYVLRRTGQYNNSKQYYSTTTLYKSYKDLDEMMDLVGMKDEYIREYIKYKYKVIYLYNDEIISRHRIKYGLYVYCLISHLIEEGIEFDILNIFNKLEDKLKISHYNKANDKLTAEYTKYYINPNIIKVNKVLIKLNMKISVIEIIKRYNIVLKYKLNINQNSILKGVIYILLKESIGVEELCIRLYSRQLSTTPNTIHRFLELYRGVKI